MFCPKCGSALEDGALFCTNCGAKMEDYQQEGPSVPPQGRSQQTQRGPVPPQGRSQQTQRGSVPPQGRPQQAQRGPVPPQGRGRQTQKKPEKQSKVGIIVLICILALLSAAIIGGAVLFVMKQKEKSEQVKDFKSTVARFEAELDASNYSSISDEVSDLMKRCQTAIDNQNVNDFENLTDEIEELRAILQGIEGDITSLEELKSSYQIMFDEKYYISGESQASIDAVMAELQTAIDNGAADQLEAMKSNLEKLEADIESSNRTYIDTLKNSVVLRDFSQATESEKKSLQGKFDAIQAAIDSGEFKTAVELAEEYSKYGEKLELSVKARIEESRQKESQATADSMKALEESIQAEAHSDHSGDSDYMCPGSDSRYLTESDIAGFSAWELTIARNEIYARHGRKFNDANIRAYFESKSWYHGTIDPDHFDSSVFNAYEKANIAFIQQHEH